MPTYKIEEFRRSRKEHNSRFSILFKLLKMYRKSFIKLVWKHFIIYVIASYGAQTIYLVIDVNHQELVRSIRTLLENLHLDERVVIVMLGCYLAKMVDRITETYKLIRFPEELLVLIATAIPGYTRLRRTLKSTIVRYVLASYILTLNKRTDSVKRKYPDLPTMVSKGILTTHEGSALRTFEPKSMEYRQPLDWAGKLISRGHSDNVIRQGAMEMLVNGLATHNDTMSRLLAHDRLGAPPPYTTVVLGFVLFYSIASFIYHVIPKNGNLVDPLTFILNPIPAAMLYACYHGIIKVAKMINEPFKYKHDYLDIDCLIHEHIEAVSECFRNMLAERQDFERDEWYDRALADELKKRDVTPETESTLQEMIDELYDEISPICNGLGTEQTDACMQVPTHTSEEHEKNHSVLIHNPSVTPSVSVQLVQETTRDRQLTAELGLKQRQKELQEIEEKLNLLRNANQQSDGMHTGQALESENVGEEDHYVDIEAVLQSQTRMQETYPAIRCKTCSKFYLTDAKVRELEEKTDGFEDISKYKKLQCKCTNAVWV